MNTEEIDFNVFDDESNKDQAISEKLDDISVPGYQAEFDPGEAEQAGAFDEDALSFDDALDSSTDSAEEA